MTYRTIYANDGRAVYLVDDIEVPQAVYETLRPSLMFPAKTGLTEAEALVILDGLRVVNITTREPHKGPYIQTGIGYAKPLKSDALAVHTSQIPAVVARNKKHGLNGLRYDRAGRPVFTDGAQRKRLMKVESEVMGKQIVDRSSYY